MNLISQIKNKLGFGYMTPWTGHHPRQRAWVFSQVDDHKNDINPYDRTRTLGLARKMYISNPLVRGAVDTMVRNSIGSGIKVQARTADNSWNEKAEMFFDSFSGICDIAGVHDFNEMQRVVATTMLRDGECFLVLNSTKSGYPQLELVESHKCETPKELSKDKRITDGVKVNASGKPLSYYFKIANDKYEEVNAEDVIVVAEYDRPHQYRAISRLGCAMTQILDRDELLTYEMQASKLASVIGLVVKRKDSSGGFLSQTKQMDNGVNAETIFGGGAIANLGIGEDLQTIQSSRPNSALDQHLEQYIRSIALALGIPYELVWKADLSGPSQRFVIGQAQRRFEEIQDVLINRLIKRVYRWSTAKAIKRGDLPENAEWYKAVYQTPKKISIDVGRDATAEREDYLVGMRSLADLAGERGDEWQEIIRQKAIEAKYIADIAREYGVEVSQIQTNKNQPQPQIIPAS